MNIKDYDWLRLVIRLGGISFLVQSRFKSNVFSTPPIPLLLSENSNKSSYFIFFLMQEMGAGVPDTVSVIAAETIKLKVI